MTSTHSNAFQCSEMDKQVALFASYRALWDLSILAPVNCSPFITIPQVSTSGVPVFIWFFPLSPMLPEVTGWLQASWNFRPAQWQRLLRFPSFYGGLFFGDHSDDHPDFSCTGMIFQLVFCFDFCTLSLLCISWPVCLVPWFALCDRLALPSHGLYQSLNV